MRSVSHQGPIHLGLEVHKETISVGILTWGQESRTWIGSSMTRRRCAG